MTTPDTRGIRAGRHPKTIYSEAMARAVCAIHERVTGDRCTIIWPSVGSYEVWRHTPEGKMVRV